MSTKVYSLHTVAVNGEEIAYRKTETLGPLVVLIHGNMSSSKHLEILMEALESKYSVYAFDLRGMGASSYNSTFDSLHELADDIAKAMEALGLTGAHVFGWSTGGGVAMSLAGRYAHLVTSLILMSSVGLTGYPMYKKGADYQPILSEPLLTKSDIEEDPIQVAPVLKALAEGDKAYYRGLWDMLIYIAGQKPSEALYEAYLEDMLTQRNLVDIDYALTRFNITCDATLYATGTGLVDAIFQPALVLYGEKDIVVPQYMTDEIVNGLTGPIRYERLVACGHNPLIDNLTEVKRLVEAHIDGLS